jgi:hypothetical protein
MLNIVGELNELLQTTRLLSISPFTPPSWIPFPFGPTLVVTAFGERLGDMLGFGRSLRSRTRTRLGFARIRGLEEDEKTKELIVGNITLQNEILWMKNTRGF